MKRLQTLSTERLYLEPLSEAYADEAWPQVDDAGMWTYFPHLRPRTVDELHALWRRWEAGSPVPTEIWLNWLCRAKASHELIGSMQATIFPASREAYIAYAVYRRHQGKGYAREACRAIIAHIFERYGIRRVYAQMDVRNEPSYRLAESLGFVRVKTHGALESGHEIITGDFLYELRLRPPL